MITWGSLMKAHALTVMNDHGTPQVISVVMIPGMKQCNGGSRVPSLISPTWQPARYVGRPPTSVLATCTKHLMVGPSPYLSYQVDSGEVYQCSSHKELLVILGWSAAYKGHLKTGQFCHWIYSLSQKCCALACHKMFQISTNS